MNLERVDPTGRVQESALMAGPGHPTLTLDAGRAAHLEFASESILLGRFKVLEPLGRGGMGAVFLVEDILSGETKALKAIPFKAVSDLPDLCRELKAAHAVTGSGIVRYFDIFVDEGQNCLLITMERVEGETLDTALARGPFTPREALRFLRLAAAILREVHAAGIVHQDLKPSNIFLLPDGGVKLGDFGISRFVDQEHGRISGTPLYMAPEQRDRSKPVTGKADWYALGLVLCEALTGDHPAAGMTVDDWRSARPEAHIAWDRIPRSLRRLLAGLLAEDPLARWGDGEVERHLRNRRFLRTAAAAAGVLAILIPSGLFALKRFGEQPVTVTAQGAELTVQGPSRTLWSRTFPSPIRQAVAADLEGDGEREVLVSTWMDGWRALREEPFLRIFDRRGAPLAAFALPPGLDQYYFRGWWRSFPPHYFANFALADLDGDGRMEWVARVQNDPYFPCVILFPPPAADRGSFKGVVSNIVHCGAMEFLGVWQGRMVFCGWNNHWLHSQAVMVVDPRRFLQSGINTIPSQSYTTGMTAYHLIGDRDIVQPKGVAEAGGFVLSTAGGTPVARLTGEFGLEGQPAGAAEASLSLIDETLNQFHVHLAMGDTGGALGRAEEGMARARELGLKGHASMFAWCRSKALMAQGRTDEALAALDEGIAINPDLKVDLQLWKALDALLTGQPRRAVELSARLTHETCGWRILDLEQLKGWIRMLSGAPSTPEGAATGVGLSEGSDDAACARLQRGWARLLEGDPPGAIAVFERDLDRPRMEEHAAGLLLAEALGDQTSPLEERLLKSCEAEPGILRFARALRAGDRAGVERAWDTIRDDRLHTPNSAIFFRMLERLAQRFPERLGWIRQRPDR